VPQWVELANGCLCCSVKAEFVQVNTKVSSPEEKRKQRKEVADVVVIT
jgi:G3E family GTPase